MSERTTAPLRCALSLLALSCGDGTRAATPEPEISMLEPSQPHYGKTYAEWAVAYMKWEFETPLSISWDVSGCTAGQDGGPVVFLDDFDRFARTRTEPCDIASDRAILFPLFTLSSPVFFYTDSVMPPDESDPQVLKLRVQGYMDALIVKRATVSVDGHELRNPESGRVEPTQYSYRPYPGDNLLFANYGVTDIPTEVEPAFVAGYWVLLAPLEPGPHDLSVSTQVLVNGRTLRMGWAHHVVSTAP